MKTLCMIVLMTGLAFAQAPTTTEKPKDETKKSDCCGGSGCCGSKDKAKDAKKGGCCGDSKEGAKCDRKPMKDDKAAPAEAPKK